MKYIPTLFLMLLFAQCGPSISQKVDACNNDTNAHPFRIYTEISNPTQKTGSIYWNFSECLTLSEVDSAKKAELSKAEYFLREYKKIRD